VFSVYRETLRPILHDVAMHALARRRAFADRHPRLSG
jgi:hypothetical protein